MASTVIGKNSGGCSGSDHKENRYVTISEFVPNLWGVYTARKLIRHARDLVTTEFRDIFKKHTMVLVPVRLICYFSTREAAIAVSLEMDTRIKKAKEQGHTLTYIELKFGPPGSVQLRYQQEALIRATACGSSYLVTLPSTLPYCDVVGFTSLIGIGITYPIPVLDAEPGRRTPHGNVQFAYPTVFDLSIQGKHLPENTTYIFSTLPEDPDWTHDLHWFSDEVDGEYTEPNFGLHNISPLTLAQLDIPFISLSSRLFHDACQRHRASQIGWWGCRGSSFGPCPQRGKHCFGPTCGAHMRKQISSRSCTRSGHKVGLFGKDE